MVTEHVNDKETLGSFIYHLCNGKDTYRLRRRATRRREWPPWAPDQGRPPRAGPRAGGQWSDSSDSSSNKC